MQIIEFLLVFVLNWLIIAFVIMLAASVVTDLEATAGKALIASLLGGLASVLLYWIFDVFLPMWWWAAGIIVLIVWLLIIRFYFGSGCVGALAIAILAVLIYLVLAWLMSIIGALLPF